MNGVVLVRPGRQVNAKVVTRRRVRVVTANSAPSNSGHFVGRQTDRRKALIRWDLNFEA